MKRLIGIFVSVLWLACAVAAQGDEITAPALQQAIDGSPYISLFDVRAYEDYDAGAIPGAECMPLDEMRDALKEILDGGFSNLAVNVYLYGDTPEEGQMAAAIFQDVGFQNVYYLSSVHAWEGALVKPGQLLGDLTTVDIYGDPVDASLIQGKKLVMVNVWATYCNPCISEMTGLGSLARELAEKDVMILGLVTDCSNRDLSANENQLQVAREIAEATQADYPHILPSMDMYRNVVSQIQAVPTTFFLDGEGMMVGSVYVGARDDAAWREIIDSTLAEME